ncbi:MAG TPA: hypothetical protein VF707_00570 [Ardenticatenaceae bacterium]|jgi:phage shock protein A
MPDLIELLREVITLTSNVNELKEQVTRLTERVENNTERIIRLEAREELLVEKAKSAYAATQSQFNVQLIERIVHLEQSQKQLPPDTNF